MNALGGREMWLGSLAARREHDFFRGEEEGETGDTEREVVNDETDSGEDGRETDEGVGDGDEAGDACCWTGGTSRGRREEA